MSEEQTDKETKSQGLEPVKPLTDEDLEAEIKVLEEQIPKTDEDKFGKKATEEPIDEGADDIRDVADEDIEKYGI